MSTAPTEAHSGLVVASHGRHCLVETPQGQRLICHPRGKKTLPVVGDRVWWQPSRDEGTIEALQTRRNLLYRQDEVRTKQFAANLDLVLILLGAEPEFSENQLMRALIAARAERIDCVVVLNKRDVQPAFDRAWMRLQPYRDMGQTVLPLCLTQADDDSLAALLPHLANKTTLVLGPSGVGKSTLINRLVPAAQAHTAEISRALNSGRHTTTSTTWYWLDAARHSALIDSPGFQEFGLYHIDPAQLATYLPDFQAHVGACRFYNCSHRHEPACAVRAVVGESGGISPNRYRLYTELYEDLSATRY